MPNMAVFVDGGYLDAVLRHEFSEARIDYRVLVEHVVGDLDLFRRYYYHCPPFQSQQATPEERERFSQMDRFFHTLRRLPRFEVRLGKLARYYDEQGNPVLKQKRVDVLMGVDLVLLAVKQRITQAALITGDSDLLPAIEVARNEGVIVHLYHGETYHDELWDACDERTQIGAALISATLREAERG